MMEPSGQQIAQRMETALPQPARIQTRPLRIRTFLGIVGAIFAGCFLLALLLPHDPYIRYQSFKGTIFEQLDWVYERLHFDKTPIDVLFVGSSRTARGANAAAIETALVERGMPLHVVNISLPASGLDIRLTEIEEALKTHPEIQLIVFGLTETLPRDGHQAFGALATPRQILGSPWLINRNLPGTIATLPYRQIELSLATFLPSSFGYHRTYDPLTYPGSTPDLRLMNDPNWNEAEELKIVATDEHAEALAKESRMRHHQIRPPILPDSLAGIEFGVSHYYIREVAKLAETHGARLAFSFLPFYQGYDMPLDHAFAEEYGPLWNATFLKPDPRNYADAAHASQIGVELLTPWFADRIGETLGNGS